MVVEVVAAPSELSRSNTTLMDFPTKNPEGISDWTPILCCDLTTKKHKSKKSRLVNIIIYWPDRWDIKWDQIPSLKLNTSKLLVQTTILFLLGKASWRGAICVFCLGGGVYVIMAYDGKYQPKNYTYNYIIYTRIHSRKKHNIALEKPGRAPISERWIIFQPSRNFQKSSFQGWKGAASLVNGSHCWC